MYTYVYLHIYKYLDLPKPCNSRERIIPLTKEPLIIFTNHLWTNGLGQAFQVAALAGATVWDLRRWRIYEDS